MKRIFAVLVSLLLPALAIACGGSDSKSTPVPASSPAATSAAAGAATPTQAPASTVAPRITTTAGPAVTSTPAPSPTVAPSGSTAGYDARSVFDVFKQATPQMWQDNCKANNPVMVKEGDPCIVTVMQAAGATQQAIDFYKQNGYFLRVFTEEGRVDYGRGSSPWLNMGRDTQQLFLNGTPALQELSSMTPQIQAGPDWKMDARYAPIAQSNPTADPWTEYGTLVSATGTTDGGQRFELSIPLLTCRACESVGQLILDLDFDSSGHFKASSLGAPQPGKR